MRKTTIALGLLAALLAAPVLAGSATGTLTVKATVTKSCTLTAQSGGQGAGNALLDFGDVTNSLLSGPTQKTTSSTANGLGIQCTNGTQYNVYVSKNTGNMAGTSGNTDTLPYSLYSDAYTTLFTTDSANPLQFTADGNVDAINFWAQIPAQTKLPKPDTYTDTVTVNVTY
jgi:spore coat protein U-like protein